MAADPEHGGQGPPLDNGAQQAPATVDGHTALVAGCLARAQPVLRALVAGVASGDALVVASDYNGFPAAQRMLPRPLDLPGALVVGRHNRCALAVPGDARVSLRHLLLTAWPGDGPLRFRGFDLGGRAGIVLADGKRVPGFSFHGHGLVSFGRTVLFVLPGGEAGAALLEGDEAEAFRRLTGLDPTGTGIRIAMSTVAEPGVAHLGNNEPREYGGYRRLDVGPAAQPRGVLALRPTKRAKGAVEVRELDVDSDQLQRGLLIGRYSDRCSLAGQGRNLSRVHALVAEEGPHSLLVYDLASTNGVRPMGMTEGPSHSVVRLAETTPVMLGHFELSWTMGKPVSVH